MHLWIGGLPARRHLPVPAESGGDPYQNDFMFATKQLQSALADNGCFACEDDDVWTYSDHRPVVARFQLTP